MLVVIVVVGIVIVIPLVTYIGQELFEGSEGLISGVMAYFRENKQPVDIACMSGHSESPLFHGQREPIALQEKRSSIQTRIESAQSYDIEHMRKSDRYKAFAAYLKVAKLGCEEALDPLERIAEDLGVKEQKELSQLYKFFNNPPKEAYWFNKAQEAAGLDFN